MQIFNLLVLLPALAATVAAMPAVDVDAPASLVARAGCNNKIGRCDKNGCNPKYASSWSLVGTCQAGAFKGCPCDKCNGQTDKCSKNGCKGERGICQAGAYQGCQCN